eukprot:CAMPEP_0176032818 /NCGR_PEP_ID=MMETSP0120_2-20121206/16203_1 /TAXON_ID=160619 /ORGANISM="Kryptoperidinium foliaceum, Strain CCMP 1326" /LENGTH=92 /DNA_ID=CAMNT_0017366139 /DNA_START=95 /DNA_END=373 /DNA_ORIENTATION=+
MTGSIKSNAGKADELFAAATTETQPPIECPANTATSPGLTPKARSASSKASATSRQLGSSCGGSLKPCPNMSTHKQRNEAGNCRTTSSQQRA